MRAARMSLFLLRETFHLFSVTHQGDVSAVQTQACMDLDIAGLELKKPRMLGSKMQLSGRKNRAWFQVRTVADGAFRCLGHCHVSCLRVCPKLSALKVHFKGQELEHVLKGNDAPKVSLVYDKESAVAGPAHECQRA